MLFIDDDYRDKAVALLCGRKGNAVEMYMHPPLMYHQQLRGLGVSSKYVTALLVDDVSYHKLFREDAVKLLNDAGVPFTHIRIN